MTQDATSRSDRWAILSAILDDAFECPTDQLESFLERACAGDRDLLHELRGLLLSEKAAPAFLDVDAVQFAAPAFEDPDEQALTLHRIGPYRLVREIGRGGMGTVYLAERAYGGFHQTVALKIIRRDLDTDAVERRFRHERQILAHLQHAHIARLYDGGATPDGVLYFVMEYVEGTTIIEYCGRRSSDITERLELFSHVCEAVQYAHRRLVVHRDLKPSNILVTAEGQVKLLDFGIAKLLDHQAMSEPGTVTLPGFQPLTPEYASPEQLRGEDITTASDVYSLGVILYELLTGSGPYPTDRRSAAQLERIVSEQIPARPSQVLLRWRHKAAVSGRIGKDLDAIVLKALKKEPDQRYASATELMDDIQRYLRGFPIAARDDSTRYRLTKFVTRNRVGVGIAALALLSLIAGLIGTTLQAGIAGRERDARRLEAERARTVADFAVGLFDMVDPTRAQGATVTVQDLVAAGVRRISELASQPTQQAMFMDVMGRVSAAAGQFQKADSLFREAVAIKIGQLGEGDPGVAESLLGLGESLLMQNRLVEAETVLDRAQRIQIAAFGSTDPRNLKYQNQLGFAYFTLGDRDHAERLLRGVLARGAEPELREHTEIVEAQYNLWRVLDYYGEYAQAEPYLRDMLRRRESEYGTDHSETAHIAFTLARNLANQEKLEESTALYQRARDTYERVYGAEGVYTIHAIYGLAQVQHRRGALREAEQGYRTAARIYATQPSSGIWQAYARVSLGQVLVLLEKPAEAEREILQGLEIYLAAQTVDTEQVAIARSWLGRALTDLARHAEAESLLLLAHDSLAKRPDRTRQNQDALRHLVQLYRTWNRPEDAIRYEQLLSEAQSKTSH